MFKHLVTDTRSSIVNNFFTENEIDLLLDIFLSYPKEMLQVKQISEFNIPWIKLSKINSIPEIIKIFNKIKDYLNTDMVLVGDNFYQTPSAYGIHTDAKCGIGYEGLIPFKNFLIPLYPDNKNIKFFTFNQRYYNSASSFLYHNNIREKLDYNKMIYTPFKNSEFFEGYEKDKITFDWWKNNINLPGIPFENFQELSIEQEFNFNVRSLIIFDSWRLHCGGNFKQYNIDYKIGLSLIGMKEK